MDVKNSNSTTAHVSSVKRQFADKAGILSASDSLITHSSWRVWPPLPSSCEDRVFIQTSWPPSRLTKTMCGSGTWLVWYDTLCRWIDIILPNTRFWIGVKHLYPVPWKCPSFKTFFFSTKPCLSRGTWILLFCDTTRSKCDDPGPRRPHWEYVTCHARIITTQNTRSGSGVSCCPQALAFGQVLD